jgi:mannose-6-phosphate isomerase
MKELREPPGVGTLHPLALEPYERELIWGGHALAARYGKAESGDASIGESWECWDGNRVASGEFQGTTIADLRARFGPRLMGGADPSRIFPILTKFIDARQALSVQVHPDDAYARRVEHQPVGKTECWYVLEAEAGASIVLGWNRETSRGEYLERVGDGSLGELLRHVPVRAGDVYYLPAGTLHSIGAGIVLFETQQASDLTYRIFDYNRPGPDGKPRELHVDKAADVLDYAEATAGAIAPLTYSLHGIDRSALVSDKNFWLERMVLGERPGGVDLEGMPLTITALDRPVEIEARGTSITLGPFKTAIVPAEVDVVMLRGLEAGAAVLAAAPPAHHDSVPRRFSRAGVNFNDSTAYLAQFP